MSKVPIKTVSFDKGNGAIFTVEIEGRPVRCFLEQDNSFLAKKASPNQTFPSIFDRYRDLIGEAALLNVTQYGVSGDIWGNLITSKDLDEALAALRKDKQN